jgi:hypothetical protein
MRSLRRLVAVAVVAAPLALAGCSQGVGDRCQVQSDCDTGLLCIIPAGGTPQSGGTCQNPGMGSDAGVGDMSPQADLQPLPDM